MSTEEKQEQNTGNNEVVVEANQAEIETENVENTEAGNETESTTNENEYVVEAGEDKTTNSKQVGKVMYPKVVPGATVKIHEKIIEKKGKELKERIQIFEGIVLARKHGSQQGSTITIRKIAKGNFGVEKIYPLFSPIIKDIEIVRQAIVKRAKLGFLRTYKKKLKTVK